MLAPWPVGAMWGEASLLVIESWLMSCISYAEK